MNLWTRTVFRILKTEIYTMSNGFTAMIVIALICGWVYSWFNAVRGIKANFCLSLLFTNLIAMSPVFSWFEQLVVLFTWFVHRTATIVFLGLMMTLVWLIYCFISSSSITVCWRSGQTASKWYWVYLFKNAIFCSLKLYQWY